MVLSNPSYLLDLATERLNKKLEDINPIHATNESLCTEVLN